MYLKPPEPIGPDDTTPACGGGRGDLLILDRIDIAEPDILRYPTLALTSVRYIVVHRCSFAHWDALQNRHPVSDYDLVGTELARRFRENAHLDTGKRVPYHLTITAGGQVEQLLPLNRRGAHARGVNWCSWAVTIIGDTDQHEMHGEQWLPLIWTLRLLRDLRPQSEIVGHTDIPGASGDPNKRCPGRHLSLDAVRREVGPVVELVTPELAEASAISAGLVLRS